MHEKQLKGSKILDWWSLVYNLCTIDPPMWQFSNHLNWSLRSHLSYSIISPKPKKFSQMIFLMIWLNSSSDFFFLVGVQYMLEKSLADLAFWTVAKNKKQTLKISCLIDRKNKKRVTTWILLHRPVVWFRILLLKILCLSSFIRPWLRRWKGRRVLKYISFHFARWCYKKKVDHKSFYSKEQDKHIQSLLRNVLCMYHRHKYPEKQHYAQGLSNTKNQSKIHLHTTQIWNIIWKLITNSKKRLPLQNHCLLHYFAREKAVTHQTLPREEKGRVFLNEDNIRPLPAMRYQLELEKPSTSRVSVASL